MILNDLAKYGISKNIFHKSLLILNCRSISKLTLNWGHELLQALGEFFSQTQKKSILKMQKLCNGTKDIWDLLKLDRVWNWCYLNKGKQIHIFLRNGFVCLFRCYVNTKLTKHWYIQNAECSSCTTVTRMESAKRLSSEKKPKEIVWRTAL